MTWTLIRAQKAYHMSIDALKSEGVGILEKVSVKVQTCLISGGGGGGGQL